MSLVTRKANERPQDVTEQLVRQVTTAEDRIAHVLRSDRDGSGVDNNEQDARRDPTRPRGSTDW